MLSNHKKRIFVLGIDGVPYSFLNTKFDKGEMPNLARFCKDNSYKRMDSVYPTVSSVAWTTFATGKNPAEHNIFGFVDRVSSPFQIKIPTAANRKAKTIWHKLSEQQKRVIVINVPITYPPEKVNGILTSCFLCTDIKKSSYPQEFSTYLENKGYVIDVDAWLARENKRDFMNKLHSAMEKRFEITFELLDKEQWDYFQLHIMETDRLFHFFWEDLEAKGEFFPDTYAFFEKLDEYIAKLQDKLPKDTRFIILSDHGFCGIKYEVQLNAWLEQEGLLKFVNGDKKLTDYNKDSICYSLLPGRIFINLEGREEKGTVKKSEYESVRRDIKQKLLGFTHPETKEKIIDKVFFREEIYSGPYLEDAADIIAHPKTGYDLKGKVGDVKLFERSHLNGMHTYDDAFICAVNCDINRIDNIQDVAGVILEG